MKNDQQKILKWNLYETFPSLSEKTLSDGTITYLDANVALFYE